MTDHFPVGIRDAWGSPESASDPRGSPNCPIAIETVRAFSQDYIYVKVTVAGHIPASRGLRHVQIQINKRRPSTILHHRHAAKHKTGIQHVYVCNAARYKKRCQSDCWPSPRIKISGVPSGSDQSLPPVPITPKSATATARQVGAGLLLETAIAPFAFNEVYVHKPDHHGTVGVCCHRISVFPSLSKSAAPTIFQSFASVPEPPLFTME